MGVIFDFPILMPGQCMIQVRFCPLLNVIRMMPVLPPPGFLVRMIMAVGRMRMRHMIMAVRQMWLRHMIMIMIG